MGRSLSVLKFMSSNIRIQRSTTLELNHCIICVIFHGTMFGMPVIVFSEDSLVITSCLFNHTTNLFFLELTFLDRGFKHSLIPHVGSRGSFPDYSSNCKILFYVAYFGDRIPM